MEAPSASQASSISARPCRSASARRAGQSAGVPKTSTAKMARVRGVQAASTRATSMLYVWGSMSTKRGVRSSYNSTLAEATKLYGVVMTSLPGGRSSARTMQCSAAVPLLTATACWVPHWAAICASKRSSHGPIERRGESSTACT